MLICSRMVCSEKKKSTENAYLMFSAIFNALVRGIVQHELGGARRTHPTPTPRHRRSWPVVSRVESKQHLLLILWKGDDDHCFVRLLVILEKAEFSST